MVRWPSVIALLIQMGFGGSAADAQGLPQADSSERAVTLPEALRLSERIQPGVVRARGDVRTAGAQIRSAWGSYLPNLTASSSASSFFSEGTSRIDPITGQL